jgi:hypothetical protein
VQADEARLRQLDLDDVPYGITTEQAKQVTASPVADRFQLTRRAKAIESKLSGDDRLALTSRPNALAVALRQVPGVREVAVWDYPFTTLRNQLRIPQAQREQLVKEFLPFAWRPTLWKARVLHFRGQRQPPSPDDPTADVADDHGEAVQIYTSPLVRPPDRTLADLGSPQKQQVYSAAKKNASYWVGLVLFDDGRYPSAENWFHDPRLSAAAGNPWRGGTLYNLARTYEAEGKLAEAIALYENDTSPQRHGNRLRGKWLRVTAANASVPAAANDP